MIGRLGGTVVFDDPETRPDPPSPPQWVPAVVVIPIAVSIIALGVSIWNAIKGSHKIIITETFDGNGHLTGTTRQEIWDPVPFPVTVNGQQYTVDEVLNKSETTYPPTYPVAQVMQEKAVQVTGYNLGTFEILTIV